VPSKSNQRGPLPRHITAPVYALFPRVPIGWIHLDSCHICLRASRTSHVRLPRTRCTRTSTLVPSLTSFPFFIHIYFQSSPLLLPRNHIINTTLHRFQTTIFLVSQDKHSQQQHQTNNTMPPRLPAARTFSRSHGKIGGAAIGVSCAVGSIPLICMIPGVEERLAAQAAVWGPRWSRGFSYVAPRVERHAASVEPRLIKGVQSVEPPLKKAAL